MRTIEASVAIDAPPTVVWDVLADGEAYAQWNPFIVQASGALVEGGRPRLRIAPPGKRAMSFRPRVVEAVPGRRLRWLGTVGVRGLVDAEHEFHLVPTDRGGTERIQRERFRGVLVPLRAGTLEPTRQGFQAMNTALRERAEARARRP